MLYLTLIRHAKSSWKDPDLSDFDRPLNKRGRHSAPLMGQMMKDKGLAVECILSSPAKRAITTARLIAAELGYPEHRIEQREELYKADSEQLLHYVQALEPRFSRVALVGHNPALTRFCNDLSGAGIDNLPTCAVAVIEFDLDDWRAVHPGLGRLAQMEYPRLYTG
jgi:phosphohistidine phosphatase